MIGVNVAGHEPKKLKETLVHVPVDIEIPPGTRPMVHLDTAQGDAARLVLAGSAAELETVALEELPVGEDHPCRPVDAYGLSKWLATCCRTPPWHKRSPAASIAIT